MPLTRALAWSAAAATTAALQLRAPHGIESSLMTVTALALQREESSGAAHSAGGREGRSATMLGCCSAIAKVDAAAAAAGVCVCVCVRSTKAAFFRRRFCVFCANRGISATASLPNPPPYTTQPVTCTSTTVLLWRRDTGYYSYSIIPLFQEKQESKAN